MRSIAPSLKYSLARASVAVFTIGKGHTLSISWQLLVALLLQIGNGKDRSVNGCRTIRHVEDFVKGTWKQHSQLGRSWIVYQMGINARCIIPLLIGCPLIDSPTFDVAIPGTSHPQGAFTRQRARALGDMATTSPTRPKRRCTKFPELDMASCAEL